MGLLVRNVEGRAALSEGGGVVVVVMGGFIVLGYCLCSVCACVCMCADALKHWSL